MGDTRLGLARYGKEREGAHVVDPVDREDEGDRAGRVEDQVEEVAVGLAVKMNRVSVYFSSCELGTKAGGREGSAPRRTRCGRGGPAGGGR